MNSSSSTPILPTWFFIATDLALIGTAAAIATLSPQPLSTGAMVCIVGCVGVGAIAGLLPLVARYERQKNEALAERQQALEALTRTVASSAEQISIAASGLHAVADLAQKNLRMAEQLPHKLQDKIAEFQSQLSAASDTEKEELERELLALRTSESERLDSVSQRIAKSSAEWAKLEGATNQHLNAANEAVAKLALGTANAIGKAQAAAEQALAQARVEAARSLGETSGNAMRAIDAAKSAALAEFETKIAAASAALLERVSKDLSSKTPDTHSAQAGAHLAPEPEPAAPTAVSNGTGSPPLGENQPSASSPTGNVSATPPSKRPRKARRDEAAGSGAPQEQAPSAPAATPEPVTVVNAAPESVAPDVLPVHAEEPLPVPAGTIPEIAPIAPNTAEPFSGHIATIPNGSTSMVPSDLPPAPPPVAPPEPPKLARKRARTEPDDEPVLGLDLNETDTFATGMTERVPTSDGTTRLLVTAYIGIGNRLYIRGNGPGLTWEKGVPLQFVSIGKWRWETNDAIAAIEFKLYKNDDLECSALGSQLLEPGLQQEVTAVF
jgi:hypothetical protein